MTVIFSALIAALIGIGGYFYTRRLFREKKVDYTRRQKIGFFVVTAVIFTAIGVLMPLFTDPEDRNVFAVLRTVSAVLATYYIGLIDLKLRIIPNKYLLVMLGWVAVLLGAEAIVDFSSFRGTIFLSLLGSVIFGLMFLFANVLSRNGLGMGDVKFMFVAGLYLGMDDLLGGLIWSLLFSIIAGAVLMIMKKAKMKTKIPMGPFFFLGFFISNVVYTISGVVGG